MFPESIEGLDKLFELGNFGSYNKTSDIDLGIQFIGDYKINEKPNMANVIWLIEGLFIVLTGYDTLQYDIELYGDMLTIKDGENETFYLDTSKIKDITPLLSCAMFSVARNQLIDTNVESNIENIFDTNKTDAIILNHLKQITRQLDDKENIVLEFLNRNIDVGMYIKNVGIDNLTEAYNSAKTQMKMYLESSKVDNKYIQTYASRKMYYEALFLAETERIKFLATYKNGAIDELYTTELIKLISAIANALSYRMEDYTCVSTVTHVVRTIQSGKDVTAGPIKRGQRFIECNREYTFSTKPFCMLGKTGLILSIIEQIGFMNRFYNHYCKTEPLESEPMDKHCFSKLFKYEFRVIDAIKLITELEELELEPEPELELEPEPKPELEPELESQKKSGLRSS